MSADWRSEGLCGQTDPDLFFSEKAEDQAEAKRLCGICPSLLPCTDAALAGGDTVGVQAGMTAEERLAHPDFNRAASAFEFLPETDEQRAAAIEKKAEVAQRRRDRAAELRLTDAPAMDAFDSLVHPLDRKARS